MHHYNPARDGKKFGSASDNRPTPVYVGMGIRKIFDVKAEEETIGLN